MRTVLANGCFDPLHYGHLLHLEAARRFGDRLIVAVTDDSGVRREKGEGRPASPSHIRAEFLRALRCVDEVIVVANLSDALRSVHPDVFVKGSDYEQNGIQEEHREICKTLGINIQFTDTEKHVVMDFINELRRR